MQIDEALEGPLLSGGVQPVDWALLVHRQVVLIKIRGQVAADRVAWLLAVRWAEAVGDKLQVLVEKLLRPRHADEFNDAIGGIVANAPIGFKQRNDAVVV